MPRIFRRNISQRLSIAGGRHFGTASVMRRPALIWLHLRMGDFDSPYLAPMRL